MKDVAKIIIYDKNSKILVLARSQTHPIFADHLDFTGGEVEKHENHIEAIVRETKEEIGLDLDPAKIKVLFNKRIRIYLSYILYGYQLDDVEPKLELSWEHSSYQWIDRDELLSAQLPRNVDPYYLAVISYIKSNQ